MDVQTCAQQVESFGSALLVVEGRLVPSTTGTWYRSQFLSRDPFTRELRCICGESIHTATDDDVKNHVTHSPNHKNEYPFDVALTASERRCRREQLAQRMSMSSNTDLRGEAAAEAVAARGTRRRSSWSPLEPSSPRPRPQPQSQSQSQSQPQPQPQSQPQGNQELEPLWGRGYAGALVFGSQMADEVPQVVEFRNLKSKIGDSYEGILNQRCVERRETASRIIALALSELRDELERRMYKYLYEKTIQEQNEA